MEIVTTSLDALLQRATNPQNENVDTAAVEAFCALVNKEKDGSHIGAKLLAARIHSQNEKEALLTLAVLDTCMKRCGNSFQAEIGKFRFLNEMIKLVSPKYLGSQTPLSIRQKVLQLMYIWTIDFPKETKIKEAYDMLKKQGVIREIPLSVSADSAQVLERRSPNSVFQDEEKSKLLQKLLQSKNPEDLQAANRLIKNMVKEDDKRAEIKNKRTTELESVQNNVRLLNEMLDSYRPGISSSDELDLIKELHQSCERLRPSVFRLVSETQHNEEMLDEALQASDELGHVFDKFTSVIIQGKVLESPKESNLSNLLDFGGETDLAKENTPVESEIDVLSDIFSVPNVSNSNVLSDTDILQPTSLLKEIACDTETKEKTNGKLKALEDLDVLGESLMKQNLSSTRVGQQFNKGLEKIPMNLLAKQSQKTEKPENQVVSLNFDLNYLEKPVKNDSKMVTEEDRNGDDLLVDITEEEQVPLQEEKPPESPAIKLKKELKLNDLFVKLESIKPSSIAPLTVLDEKNGITVTLHLAKDKPRENVTVIVVTTVSRNEQSLSNYLFQAVVPKGCKLKLQPPSGTELPPFNPFLPPSAITQIMLIGNPENTRISLKFVVSYMMDDETVTEMGEVADLPVIP